MLNRIKQLLMLFIAKAYSALSGEGIFVLKDKALRAKSKIKKEIILKAYNFKLQKHGSWIGYNCQLTDIPCFPHGIQGIFISGGAKIGRNCIIYQQVTIGSNTLPDSARRGSPTIGDNVLIGAGAKIIGNLTIGNNVRIGANVCVVNDVPDNSTVVMSTRVICKENKDNHYYTQQNGRWVFWEDGKWHEAKES